VDVPAGSNNGAKPAIYIAGGCDSPNGNTYVTASGLELDFFLCNSYSDKLWAFDPETNTFRERASLPRKRYRHAGVSAAGKLWLVGGRTIPDDIVIAEVDVYDPATDSWSTVGTIPEEYLTSDNGAFANADGSTVYVVGGFNPKYYNPDALATTFSFETASALLLVDNNQQQRKNQQQEQLALSTNATTSTATTTDLVVTRRADMITQRGGAQAVSSKDATKAFVAGGFSSYPCEPLRSAEVYDLEKDEWFSAGNLQKARGDGAMVEASGTIFAIGGEVSHPDQCGAPELVPPLSHQSLAVDDVEALEYGESTDSNSTNTWVDVANIPEFRFRFTAASWPATGVAYAFGGQVSFDESCKCFPTTDEITVIDSKVVMGGSGTLSHTDNGTTSTSSEVPSDTGITMTNYADDDSDSDEYDEKQPISTTSGSGITVEEDDDYAILDDSAAASSWNRAIGIFSGILSLIVTTI